MKQEKKEEKTDNMETVDYKGDIQIYTIGQCETDADGCREMFAILSPFAKNIETAYNLNYTRNISRSDRRKIFAVHAQVTGDKSMKDVACSNCIRDVLKDLYPYYVELQRECKKKINPKNGPGK